MNKMVFKADSTAVMQRLAAYTEAYPKVYVSNLQLVPITFKQVFNQ